ncbi:MAG: hypothetical protein R3234_06405 [Thermoanaerobaculia bacterium]|nr:hypothetical protein [Thermoanaerobaculia bacterium]
MAPWIPALLVLAYSTVLGSLFQGAGGWQSAIAAVVTVAVVSLGSRGPDPLGLGRARWLVPLLWGWLGLCLWMSPVPRAGRTAVLLFPLLVGIAGLSTRLAHTPRDRTRTVEGMAFVGVLLATWSLVDRAIRGTGPVAMPLGHHLLLGLVLVILFPFALVAVRRRSRWLWIGPLLILGALLASGSILALLGLGAALLLLPGTPDGRSRANLAAILALVSVLVLFLATDLGPEASSLRARLSYWEAGLDGGVERSLTGWGPGSTPWTAALHLRPRPGVNPPGELVGDLHSLPITILYELGVVGLLLVGVLVWAWFRKRSRKPVDPIARAARAGVAGGLVVLLGGVTLGTLAPWIVLAAAAGLARRPEPEDRGGAAWPWRGVALLAGAALLPGLVAQVSYDRARRATDDLRAATHLDRAVRWDPSFPLYRARSAWLPVPEASPGEALEAAEAARGVADLWLAAGHLLESSGGEESRDRARESFLRACDLDPLAALAPLLAARTTEPGGGPAELAARALVSEPRLAAARGWGGSLPPRNRVLDLLEEWPGVDAGWRLAAGVELRTLRPGGPRGSIVREIDADPATSLSLHLFRRQPWPREVASVPIWLDALRSIDLPRAAELPTTSRDALPPCSTVLDRPDNLP